MVERWPRLLRGVLPVSRSRLLPEVLAGLTLAALSVPEVLGYARIAGMPVVTGLYTMLVPLAVFALLGFSRHLVVGADSATAAILAAGLTGLASPGSPRYVQLAGTAALLVAAVLVAARVLRLGFVANFLSRTVLVGFLTGVGIQVSVGQLGAMLGVEAGGGPTLAQLPMVLRGLPHARLATVLVSVGVIAVVLGIRLVTRRIPGALLAVAGAILASYLLALPGYGVAVLGQVPAGLPPLEFPGLESAGRGLADLIAMAPLAVSLAVVILAQSAATSRAYAARYDEPDNPDADLVGLAGANLAAALSGAFVVNGSPTKTQMADDAGGRSQLTQLSAAAVVGLVLVVATGPLAGLPLAALAAVVFLIGVELVDLAGLRRIYAVRKGEFGVAVLTAAAVVLFGVQLGIGLAILASMVDHLRHSYHPRSSVLAKSPAGHWRSMPVCSGARAAAGLVIYRFGTSLYFANAPRLVEDVATLTRWEPSPAWFCLDGAAIGDVDYSAALVLGRVLDTLRGRGIRVACANFIDPVRTELDRYGLSARIGSDGFYETPGETLSAYEAWVKRRTD